MIENVSASPPELPDEPLVLAGRYLGGHPSRPLSIEHATVALGPDGIELGERAATHWVDHVVTFARIPWDEVLALSVEGSEPGRFRSRIVAARVRIGIRNHEFVVEVPRVAPNDMRSRLAPYLSRFAPPQAGPTRTYVHLNGVETDSSPRRSSRS